MPLIEKKNSHYIFILKKIVEHKNPKQMMEKKWQTEREREREREVTNEKKMKKKKLECERRKNDEPKKKK